MQRSESRYNCDISKTFTSFFNPFACIRNAEGSDLCPFASFCQKDAKGMPPLPFSALRAYYALIRSFAALMLLKIFSCICHRMWKYSKAGTKAGTKAHNIHKIK